MINYKTIFINNIDEYNEYINFHQNDFILAINRTDNSFILKTSENKNSIYGVLTYNNFNNLKNFNINNFEYYYEDISSNILNNVLPFKFDELNHLNEYNIAPYNAHKIGIYNSNKEKIGEIYLDKYLKKKYDTRLYRVGLLSDIHFNDSDFDYLTDNDNSEYKYDLDNALQFMSDKNSVEFTCISGDISTDSYIHLETFKQYINDYHLNKPIFCCKGNHDYKSCYYQNALYWHDHTWQDVNNNYEIHWQDDNEKDNFYFIKPFISRTGDTKYDVYIFLSINYSYYGNEAHSSIKVGEGENDYQYFRESDIDWLENVLETYKHTRCFVFCHYFLKNKAGNNNGDNSLYVYCSHGRTRRYTLWGHQFDRLNSLNNKYINSIWFSGHSHYKWVSQKFDPTINICGNNYSFIENTDEQLGSITRIEKLDECGYNVHIPSGARPLNEVSYYDALTNESEGGIMDVYEDYVDIRGIEFKTARTNLLYNHDNNYLNIIQNIIDKHHINRRDRYYVNSHNIVFDNYLIENQNVVIRDLNDDFVEIEVFDKNVNIYIRSEHSSLSNKFIPILKLYDFRILDGETYEDITQSLKLTHNIGFVDTLTNTNDMKCYIESYHPYTTFNEGIKFTVLPNLEEDNNIVLNHFIIRFKAKIKFIELNLKQLGYENKYTPLAHYRLYNRTYIEKDES